MLYDFTFTQLDPRPTGREFNELIFARGLVFGVEVTIPALAARCVFNLDHHGRGDTAETPSAVEQALTASLPTEVATIATVRPDADSVGAMAVLANRVEDRPIDAELVSAIGRFDRLGHSAGRAPDLVVALARVAANHRIPLYERVEWAQRALAGEADVAEVARLVAERDAEFAAARAASEVTLHAGGRIVCVTSTHRFATNLGYEVAQVVVAFNPAMLVDPRDASKGTYRKFTVCRYDSHVPVDLEAALADLQAMEPGWGGRGDIFGSPQGVSSILTTEQVVAVVARHLK